MSDRVEIDPESVAQAIEWTNGNIARAARILHLSRPRMHRALAELRLDSRARELRVRTGFAPSGRGRPRPVRQEEATL